MRKNKNKETLQTNSNDKLKRETSTERKRSGARLKRQTLQVLKYSSNRSSNILKSNIKCPKVNLQSKINCNPKPSIQMIKLFMLIQISRLELSILRQLSMDRLNKDSFNLMHQSPRMTSLISKHEEESLKEELILSWKDKEIS